MNKITTLIFFSLLSILTITAQTVTSGADSGPGTLRDEIANASPGDVITFSFLVPTVTLNTEIVIDKEITITGNTIPITTIDGDNNDRIFNITSGPVVLNNLEFTNGLADDGGALYVSNATVTVNNSFFTENRANGAAGSGGAIFNDVGGVLNINNTEFTDNIANRAGGAIEDAAGTGLNITLNDVDMDGNNAGVAPATAAPGNGGAVHITGPGSMDIINGTFTNNIAAAEGGALWNGLGTMTIDGSEINGNTASGNSADQGGGGVFNNGGTLQISGNASILNNIADGNAGSGGGVLSVDDGSVTISNTTISNNSAVRAGGGIEINSTTATSDLNMTSVVLVDNSAESSPGNGGGLHITGPATSDIVSCTFTNNLAAAEGGGLWNGSGIMMVDSSDFVGNTASGASADQGGGGVFNAGGNLTIENSNIESNVVDGAAGSGGGILNDLGTLTVINTSINDNAAVRAGGGIEDNSMAGNTLTLIDVDFDGNAAFASPGNGGALHITGPGDSDISGGLVTGNTAALEGGGFWNGSGTMTVDGTTLDGNTASGSGTNEGGGALFNAGGTLMVEDALITNNVADGASGSGGGILNDNGILEVIDSEISNNTAERAGGGIEDNSVAGNTLVLTDVSLLSNSALSTPGNGGGLHISGPGNSTITDCTINDNVATLEGGGLWNGSGEMTVTESTLERNTASGPSANEGGGGIFNDGGTLIVMNSNLNDNVADGAAGSGGGILNDLGVLTVMDTELNGNSAVRAGGGIEDNSMTGNTLNLTNIQFIDNVAGSAPGNGGGLHITGDGDAMIIGGEASGNSAAREGGGLWNGAGTMTVQGMMIDNNEALGVAADDGGAGIFNNGGTLNILSGTMITNNVASGASASGGGLLSTAGMVTIDSVTFENNSANRAGGAIELIDGDMMLTYSDFDANDVNGLAGTAAPGNGGAIHITGNSGQIDIDYCTFTNNAAGRDGGALWNQSGTVMNVSNTSIDANMALGAAADNGGGGVYNNGGTLDITLSTLSNNMAMGTAASGGGVTNAVGGTMQITVSTLSGNSANGDGGAIVQLGDSFYVNATTIYENDAAGMGGGIHGANNIVIENTLVSGNTAGSGNDVSGTVTSNNSNLVSDDDLTVFTNAGNDIIGSAANLGVLQDNGGATFTHNYMANSPGINAGNPSMTFNDQNGNSIVLTRDIGSTEYQGAVAINDISNGLSTSIYPNPVNDVMQFEVENTDNIEMNVTIVNVAGSVVRETRMSNQINKMNVSDLTPGIYWLKVAANEGIVAHKFMVQ